MAVIVVILGMCINTHTTHTHITHTYAHAYIERENMFLCLSSVSINNKILGSPFFWATPSPLLLPISATPMSTFLGGIKMHQQQQQQRKPSVFIYFAASS